VLAATHRDLEKEIAAGRFRDDLFYRLNVVPIRTPALRERREDIPALIDYFVRRYAQANNYRPKVFAADAVEHLQGLPWRGNVRELKNLIERLLILVPGETVRRQHVLELGGASGPELSESLLAVATLREFRDSAERLFIVHKLERHGWNVTQTAQAIDTPRSNLYKKMEAYGIRRHGQEAEDPGAGAEGRPDDEVEDEAEES
jgi:two-component system nitrogen regulation response regulator NtrX